MENPWRRLDRRIAFTNAWMEVRDDRVVRPDGSEGTYAHVHFRNLAVGVLPLLADGRVVLVGQWRYTLGAYSWEIPAGGCRFEDGEAPRATAARELAEETGLAAAELIELGTGHLSNSITDEVSVMFLARGVAPCPHPHAPDPTERIRLRTVARDELLAMIRDNVITDALTLTTVLRYQLWAGASSTGV